MMTPRRSVIRTSFTIGLTLGLGLSRPALADDPSADALKFFESQVRPVLVQNCQKCHGPEKQKGGLRLDSKAATLEGGETGPAVVPGKPEESLLVEAINFDGLEMPPTGKLADEPREALLQWVKMGAPWPESPGQNGKVSSLKDASRTTGIHEEDRAFWSFQPVRRPDPPAVDDQGWSRTPVDRFVFDKLNTAGLSPAPEADRRTLIRRLTFDLWGLPPDPAEVEAFANNESAEAYDQLVERLLASPHYGERWARHWLDLARYAESDGYRQDAYRPDAWRYRDYVVDAFNQDKPYDQFVREQLAGDELNPESPESRVAVGFLRLGTYEYNQRDVPGQWSAILNDLTDVTGDVFLGLGIGCARCHDHKFDPILQRDYFRLQAFFNPILPRDDLDLLPSEARAEYQARLASWEARTAEIRQAIAEVERPYHEQAAKDAISKFPEEIQELLRIPENDRDPLEKQLTALAYRQVSYEHDHIGEKIKKTKDQARWEALQKELAQHDRENPEAPRTLTVTDVGPVAPPTIIPGDRSRTAIEPGFLTILDPKPATVEPLPASTGRRTALANWLTNPDHPLTTRVIVNRVWQYHFGKGLVGTSSDFGRLGEKPSHPELLDWLATEFVEQGWSLKSLHRLIVSSTAYRQSSRNPSPGKARESDPENRLIWRAPTRRLDVEPIRDAMLAVSGEVDRGVGGPAVELSEPRRSVYTKVVRNSRDPLFEAFDAPDGSNTTPQRIATVTPVQALLMINGKWSLARAKGFAARLRREAETDQDRIALAYRLAFGRPPNSTEPAEALRFLREQTGKSSGRTDGEADALVDFCHALLNSNEFLYVD